MRTEKELVRALEIKAIEAAAVKEELYEVRSRKLLKCSHCNRRTRVCDLVLIQRYWYEEPYGCTGGDRWHKGELQYECPKCGKRNRSYNRPEIEELRRYFKETVDEHKRSSRW